MFPPQSFAVSSGSPCFEAFCLLLEQRAGLQVREKDRAALASTLTARCQALRLSDCAYLELLRGQRTDEGEWAQLMPMLTNGESYFERDRGQFALLRDTLLPELIERKRSQGERILRLWSAGCSTGEEAYSLAMTARDVLPTGWKAMILGTDINPVALSKARRGVYGAWSFRGVEAHTRERFFRAAPEGFELLPDLRENVSFGFCNLNASDWPDAGRGIANMDLIVCRNVLIYLQREAVAGVVSRFARTLGEGGFLLCGHAELHDQNVAPLRVRLFRESVVYQKDGGAQNQNPLLPSSVALAPRLPEPPKAGRVFFDIPIPAAPKKVEAPRSANDWCAQARRHADAGQHAEAIACCEKAIAADAGHVGAHLLWAQIVEEQGNWAQAKTFFKKVIYLAPSQVEAYVELGALYEREGDLSRARQMRRQALELLRHRAGDETLPDGARVEDMRNHLQETLDVRGAEEVRR